MTLLTAVGAFEERLTDAIAAAKRAYERARTAATASPKHRPGMVQAFARHRFLQVTLDHHKATRKHDVVNPTFALAGGLHAFIDLAGRDLQVLQGQATTAKAGRAEIARFTQAVNDYPSMLRGALDAHDDLNKTLKD